MNLKDLTLRRTLEQDLPELFVQQSDPLANHMAAFTGADPYDEQVFLKKWRGVLNNPSITMWSLVSDRRLLGSVVVYPLDGEPQLSYWIDRRFWSQGVASRGVQLVLSVYDRRPLFAAAAEDNLGSRAVLVKNGFQLCGKAQGYANARGAEITEMLYRLD